MAASGQGGLGAVSAGISEALVTTAVGLLVAIPAVMAFNYFTNAIEAVRGRHERRLARSSSSTCCAKAASAKDGRRHGFVRPAVASGHGGVGRRSTGSARAQSDPARRKNEINVTPLVDVVLVLLIIFMVVTPMLHRGVQIELPSHRAPREEAGHRRAAGRVGPRRRHLHRDRQDPRGQGWSSASRRS